MEGMHAKCLEIQQDYYKVFLPLGSQRKDLPVEFCNTKTFPKFYQIWLAVKNKQHLDSVLTEPVYLFAEISSMLQMKDKLRFTNFGSVFCNKEDYLVWFVKEALI